jgi:hypothetical protein
LISNVPTQERTPSGTSGLKPSKRGDLVKMERLFGGDIAKESDLTLKAALEIYP